MRTSADGTVSFKKKGRMDASFIRVETNCLVLLATRAGYVRIASTNLSEPDRLYICRLTAADEPDASLAGQSLLVRNELSRRKREATKLRDDAAAKRRLAQIELDDADGLENQAARLATRSTYFGIQLPTQELPVEPAVNSSNARPATATSGVNSNTAAAIAAGAADQLQLDIARFRHQAQDKRIRASKLQNEAAALERTAAEETHGVTCPDIAH